MTVAAPTNEIHAPLFAIITVIREEEEKIREYFGLKTSTRESHRVYYSGTLPGNQEGTHVNVITAKCAARSNIPAAVLATELLLTRKPDYLLLVDIGGGVASEKATHESVDLGDVVVLENLVYYEFAKLSPGQEKERRFLTQPPSEDLKRVAEQIADEGTEWWSIIKESRPESASQHPKVLIGDMLCGEKLLGDPSSKLLKSLLQRFDKTLSVDMESVGVARAVFECVTHRQVKFIVIRGISDYCNKEGNQEVREKWRKYAAASAAALALKLVRQLTESPDPAELLSRYLSKARTAFSEYAIPKRTFALTSLADGHQYDSTLALIAGKRRVLLQGPPGSGKTVTLQRAAAAAIESGFLPVVVSLKNANHAYIASRMETERLGPDDRLNVILENATPPCSATVLKALPQDRQPLLLVDGLNELYGDRQVDWVLDTLGTYLDTSPDAQLVVTDRLVERRNLSSSWTRARLELVSAESVLNQVRMIGGDTTHLDAVERELLRLPFFLNQAVEAKDLHLGTAAGSIARFFAEHLKLDNAQLNALSEAAFKAYESDRSRTFESLLFLEAIGDKTEAALKKGGLLHQQNGGRAQFSHQLYHDFLAARFVAQKPSIWSDQTFDALTFQAVSLATLNMLVEQLHDADTGDSFIRSVYDWSWSGAISTTAHAAHLTARRCTEQIEVAISCLIAEKKFDPVRHTRSRASRAFEDFKTSIAQTINSAKSLQDVIVYAKRHESSKDWFRRWLSIFTAELSTSDLVAAIVDEDPIVGWSAANSCRRSTLESAHVALAIRHFMANRASDEPMSRSIRWRIVHLLGRVDEPESFQLLLQALVDDSHSWVRYGAARSLVELAATTKTPERRRHVLESLTEHASRMGARVLLEAGQALLYRDAPDEWRNEIAPLLRAGRLAVAGESRRQWDDIELALSREEEWRTVVNQ